MFFHDLRDAWRSIRRAPVVTSVVILSLGVGVGANTVVFSWIQALVFRPLPGVQDAAAFHVVEPVTDAGTRPGVSWLEYRDLVERLSALSDLVAFRMTPLNVGDAGRTERTSALLVSGNYFSGLGLRPAAGRFLRLDEVSRPGADPVVVISHDFWQTRLGGSPAVVGRSLRVNDRDVEIVGVTPAGFQGTVLGLQFDLWVPATLAPALLAGSRELDDRALRGYYVMGRLVDDATLVQAQTETDAAMRDLALTHPEASQAVRAEVLPFWRASRGPQGFLLQGLAGLQAIMLLLLAAVCGNTATLVLTRISARHRELGVRRALGARPWMVTRLLLVEGVLLGLGATALGVALAYWGTNALRAVPVVTMAFPVRFQTDLDAVSLVFASALGLGGALVASAAPALQLARVDPHTALRAVFGSTGAPRSRLRGALIAVEVALATMVLVVAGLLVQSFRQTWEIDTGFRREGVLLAAYDLTGRDVDLDGARRAAARLLQTLGGGPGVEAVGIAVSVPLDIHGLPNRSFVLEGRARTDGALDRALSNTVTPGYFAALDIPILAGADFAGLDDTAAPRQAVVNEAFVSRHLDGSEPLGRRIRIGAQEHVITGVVRTSLYESFGEAPTPIVYLSYRDRPARAGEIHLRTRPGTEALLASVVQSAMREVDPGVPIYNVRTMSEHVEMSQALRRIPARMFVVLGPLLLALAAIGIYAVVSYAVAQRTAEIGVRLALGASSARVVSEVVMGTLRLIVAGAAVGWLIVFMLYSHLVRGVIDVLAFGAIPMVLLLVAALACWLPARRAAAVDPMVALRQEW